MGATDERVGLQSKRVEESIKRLTLGTPFEGIRVSFGHYKDEGEAAFRTIARNAPELFWDPNGILVSELEGLSEEALDQYFYEKASLAVRPLLNKPND